MIKATFPLSDAQAAQIRFSHIIVHSIDRLSRNTEYGLRDIRQIQDLGGQIFVFTEPGLFTYGTDGEVSAQSLCLITMRLAMCTLESAIILERTKAGVEKARGPPSIFNASGHRKQGICHSADFHKLFSARLLNPDVDLPQLCIDINKWLASQPLLLRYLNHDDMTERTLKNMAIRLHKLYIDSGATSIKSWLEAQLTPAAIHASNVLIAAPGE